MRILINTITNPLLVILLSLIAWLYFSNWDMSMPISKSLFTHPFYHIIIIILLAERFTYPIIKKIDTFEIVPSENDKIDYDKYIESFNLSKEVSFSNLIALQNLNLPTFEQFTYGKYIVRYINDKFINAISWNLGMYFFGATIVPFINRPPYPFFQILFGFSYWILLSILFNRISEFFIAQKLKDIFGKNHYNRYLYRDIKTIFKFKVLSSILVVVFTLILLLNSFSKEI